MNGGQIVDLSETGDKAGRSGSGSGYVPPGSAAPFHGRVKVTLPCQGKSLNTSSRPRDYFLFL